MEIRIDTGKDSKEDIRKAIKLLQNLVDGTAEQQCFPSGENVFGGMFDAADTAGANAQDKPAEAAGTKPEKKGRISISGLDVY